MEIDIIEVIYIKLLSKDKVCRKIVVNINNVMDSMIWWFFFGVLVFCMRVLDILFIKYMCVIDVFVKCYLLF